MFASIQSLFTSIGPKQRTPDRAPHESSAVYTQEIASSIYPYGGRPSYTRGMSSPSTEALAYGGSYAQAPSPSSPYFLSSYPGAEGNPYAATTTSLVERSSISSTTNLTAGVGARPPYSPGMRSTSMSSVLQSTSSLVSGRNEPVSNIQLQDYVDGSPPAPPVSLSWRRINRWAEKNYPELYDQICDSAAESDILALERETECSLPADVRESLLIHDGQERGCQPCGLFFGVALLDTDEIVSEWAIWRDVALKLEAQQHQYYQQQFHRQQSPSSSSSGPSASRAASVSMSTFGKTQASVPENAIQNVYANTSWLPLAKDFVGNNIAIDMSPGPAGSWGQVILFGREFDCKYVIARSWAHFLAMFADDLEDGLWSIDEETEELWFTDRGRFFNYFDVLRRRVKQNVRRKSKKHTYPAGQAPAGPAVRSTPSVGGLSARSVSGSTSNSPNASTTNLKSQSRPVPLTLTQSGGHVAPRLTRVPVSRPLAGEETVADKPLPASPASQAVPAPADSVDSADSTEGSDTEATETADAESGNTSASSAAETIETSLTDLVDDDKDVKDVKDIKEAKDVKDTVDAAPTVETKAAAKVDIVSEPVAPATPVAPAPVATEPEATTEIDLN
ncbi:uncharacterized protein V1510DRAFT_106940 [Dipodascopsis tothii]|uniref:uncharacterized protein n=1 Tax=Dipodascopsis tothii TaxID=44089 RepID=UPI0034CFA45A